MLHHFGKSKQAKLKNDRVAVASKSSDGQIRHKFKPKMKGSLYKKGKLNTFGTNALLMRTLAEKNKHAEEKKQIRFCRN